MVADACDHGCLCAEGFVRDKDENCVPRDDCPSLCGTNEELSECAGGIECQATCERPDGPRLCQGRECQRGCACKPDFYRDANGVCVKPEQCPQARNIALILNYKMNLYQYIFIINRDLQS